MPTGAIELPESGEYRSLAPLNLYDSPQCDRLATQAATGRHLRIVSLPLGDKGAVRVRLCEDDYPGWLTSEAVAQLEPTTPYMPVRFSEMEIRDVIPQVIEFTHQAMAESDYYLWGGTLGPNYDCSGLMQAAFASVGVWLPRDAYQQEAFTLPIATDVMQPGDLVFFGTPLKATHVGLYLGDDQYIHSSGRELGHNGIAIDRLREGGGQVSRNYRRILRGAGRVSRSYQPGDLLNLQPD
ncbi:MAG: C40 family peptidase [Sodalinema sp.]|uniref:C40 family peptidase n=1 Tax=Sodalinema sp. TaxID=3080550 RepID=UPI001206A723|nr:MAG: NlpC/P60 family protein [Phormidium sp. SL48-SHIP]